MNKSIRHGVSFAIGCLALMAGVVFTAQTFGANYQRFDDLIVRGTASIGSNSTPDSKAVLDLTSTTLGFLEPRMSTANRDAIASPTTGLQIFNSSTGYPNYYNGTSWLQLASLTGTETLTNKTLSGNTATNLVSGSGTFTFNTSGTITAPNATDTLVGKATTDVLTNKTLTGNTAANLISGSGTLTLNTSGTITIPNGTDTLVGKATTDTLTNKTLTSPTINSGTINTPTIDVVSWDDQASTPATPSSGIYKMYFKTDGNLYSLNSSGVESAVGSSGAGGTNNQREFISNGTFESATTGWSTYADAAAATPADGTGGSPNVTINRTTTAGEVIRGSASLELVKGAANRQGEGVSYDFTIDYQDYKNLQPVYISFDYNTTANYASSDIQVFVYDKDAATLLNVRDVSGLNGALVSSTNGTKFTGYFYPTTSTSDDYRLIFHIASTNASAYDFHVDSVHVGIDTPVPGAIITQWKSETCTASLTTNTTTTCITRRVGEELEVWANLQFSGAPNNTSLQITLPSGYTMNTGAIIGTAVAGSNPRIRNSNAHFYDNGVTQYTGYVVYNSSTSVTVYVNNASSTYVQPTNVSSTVPFTFGNTDSIDVFFSVPISNWQPSMSLSTTDTLYSSVKYTGTFSQTVNNTTPSITLTDSTDPMNVVVSSTFTAPKTGRYRIDEYLRTGSATWTAGNAIEIYYVQNGGSNTIFGRNNMAAYTGVAQLNGAIVLDLVKGDTLAFKAYSDQSQTSGGTISITESPDFSVFSTYGAYELKSATSSQKTPSATNHYHSHTGNSLTLTTGTWRLFGKAIFEPSGTPAYTGCFTGWYGANGADSSSAPTALSAVTGLTIVSSTGTSAQVLTGWNNTSASFTDCYINAQDMIVRCSAATCVVYLDTYASMTTAGSARITVYPNAERLQ